MDYSSPLAIQVRRLGQKLRVLRPAVRLYRLIFPKGYEQRFQDKLLGAIFEGMIVWDVGANVGVYTKLFAERVGLSGKVVAFEPSPKTFPILRDATRAYPTVLIHNAALSNEDGGATFYISKTDTGHGTTDSLIPSKRAEADAVIVTALRGDSPKLGPTPNVVKIDVEGFELEVLQGMSGILSKAELRAIFIEVHFLELMNRGLAAAPQQIVDILHAFGFTVSWTDPSHIAAERRQ
jgi:FkbM family methyltransferase